MELFFEPVNHQYKIKVLFSHFFAYVPLLKVSAAARESLELPNGPVS